MATNNNKQVVIPSSINFLFGGLSGMGATCFVQPLDLVKNRMQLIGASGGAKGVTSVGVIKQVVKNEGLAALYAGLSAGLLRQASYTTVRLGVYNTLMQKLSTNNKNGKSSILTQLTCGSVAGATGAFFGTPAEVSLIRMTSDGRLPVEKRRNYKNVFNALARITREEGVLALWTGCTPTIGRAILVNMCQLVSYSQAKDQLKQTGYLQDGIMLHFCASMISGLITTAASIPVDIAKTRLQNMRVVDGKPEYRGTIDVIMRVVKNEGVLKLWRGFTPYYARLGPHTVLTFIIMEQLNDLYRSRASA